MIPPSICIYIEHLKLIYNFPQNSRHKAYERLCIEKERKLLVFCDGPLAVWMNACFLLTLGFKVLAIRSMHTPGEREETRRLFNNSDVVSQMLFTSIEVSAASTNLQKACSKVVFVTAQRVLLNVKLGPPRGYITGMDVFGNSR